MRSESVFWIGLGIGVAALVGYQTGAWGQGAAIVSFGVLFYAGLKAIAEAKGE